MLAEKVRQLPESQAQVVLAFIEELSASRAVSATELMRLPLAERRRILAHQVRQAEPLYRRSAEMIVEDHDQPLNYE